jgi:hypothetical protein
MIEMAIKLVSSVASTSTSASKQIYTSSTYELLCKNEAWTLSGDFLKHRPLIIMAGELEDFPAALPFPKKQVRNDATLQVYLFLSSSLRPPSSTKL